MNTPARMKLAGVIGGVLDKPIRCLVYGVDGVGKTTFAAGAPSPIFIGAEDGTSQINVARFPEPHSWRDAFDALHELETAEHEYKTVVIDTLDWLEPMCWAHIMKGRRTKDGKAIESIDDLDYGRGYTAALDEWRELCARLDRVRARRGMGVVLLAHAWIKKFANPEGEDFDRFEVKLHQKAAGLLREWADAVLFANFETLTHGKKGQRHKGISTGARILQTRRTAAADAKNRYSLPEILPLDWSSFAEAVANRQPADPEALRARITELLQAAKDEALSERVRRAVEAACDNAQLLARIENKLAAQVSVDDGNSDDNNKQEGATNGNR